MATRTKAKAKATKKGDAEPADSVKEPVVVVPLYRFQPSTDSEPWGDQYAEGPLDEERMTFPGVPITVKTQAFAQNLYRHRLAAPVEGFRLEMLPAKFHDICDNRARWSQPFGANINTNGDG